jgi:hypothetical protein
MTRLARTDVHATRARVRDFDDVADVGSQCRPEQLVGEEREEAVDAVQATLARCRGKAEGAAQATVRRRREKVVLELRDRALLLLYLRSAPAKPTGHRANVGCLRPRPRPRAAARSSRSTSRRRARSPGRQSADPDPHDDRVVPVVQGRRAPRWGRAATRLRPFRIRLALGEEDREATFCALTLAEAVAMAKAWARRRGWTVVR